MKQKDIALIAVIAVFSGVIAFFASRWLFASPKDRQQPVEKVGVITSEFPDANPKYFNAQSIDPTQLIKIGGSSNPNPFNSKQ